MYADVNWGGDLNDKISYLGYVLFFWSNLVSWSSKNQQVISRSSTKVKYELVANALAELIWVCNLLNELGITIPNTPTIFCDNVGITYLCHNLVCHSHMKHIVVGFCYVRNKVQAHQVLFIHTHACDKLAKTFIKPLPKPAFLRCCSKLRVFASHLT